jgi:hypothetical protein
MSKAKLCFFLLIFICTVASDIAACYGCSYTGRIIGWKQVCFGLFFQIVGLILLFKIFRKFPGKVVEDLIPADYGRYGLFRSKWYYMMMLVSLGTMLFASGLNHPNLHSAFGIGDSWWSCPK